MKHLFCALLAFGLPVFAADAPSRYLSYEQKNILSQAALDAYIRMFNTDVKSGRDAKFLFAREQGPTNLFESLGEAPHLERSENTLILRFPKQTLKVNWPDLSKNQVFIEGESWAFDPSAPLQFQIDSLNQKVKAIARKNLTSSYRFSILPEANAAVPAIVAACIASNVCTWAAIAVGGAIVGNWGGKIADTATSAASELTCYAVSELGYRPWNSIGWCRNWKVAQEDWRKKALAAEAVEKDPNVEWVAGNPKCPPKDEKGNEIFDAFLAEIRKKANGDWPEEAKWIRMIAKMKDGYISEAYIFDASKVASLSNLADAQQKWTYTKDKVPELESVTFLLPDGKPLTYLTTDAPADIRPDFRDKMVNVRRINEAAQAWARTCKTMARAAKVSPATAVDAARQMQRQEIEPSGQPVPAFK